MAMDDNVTDWTELREFQGVELGASFVLSWRYDKEVLEIDADVCLTPKHAFYEPPRPSEGVCIMPAVIEFPVCERLVVAGRNRAQGAIKSLTGRLRHGRIKSLQRIAEGIYRIDGEFGEVEIHAERPLLRLRARLA